MLHILLRFIRRSEPPTQVKKGKYKQTSQILLEWKYATGIFQTIPFRKRTKNFDGSTIFAKKLQETADLFCVIHQNPPPYQKNGGRGGGGGLPEILKRTHMWYQETIAIEWNISWHISLKSPAVIHLRPSLLRDTKTALLTTKRYNNHYGPPPWILLMDIINILVLRPFQLQQEKKTNGGYKHYP